MFTKIKMHVITLILIIMPMMKEAHGGFYIRNAAQPNFVLDLADMNPCANARVIMCPSANKPSQMWDFHNLTMIKNMYSGYFLDMRGSFGAGADVIVWPGHGGKNQQWAAQTDQTLRNQNGLYADIADNQIEPGAQVIGYYHTGRNNQKFEFIRPT